MGKYAVLAVSVAALTAAGAGLAVAGYAQTHGRGGTGGQATGGSISSGGSYAFARLSCAGPAGLAGSLVEVTVIDMEMTRMMGGTAPRGARMMFRATPATVPAGQVSFVVSDEGWRTHELVVLPLAAGQAAGGRLIGRAGKVDEPGSLGEASASCAGDSGTGIASGAVGWTTAVLRAGRYEVLCDLENHYAGGMWQELDVARGPSAACPPTSAEVHSRWLGSHRRPPASAPSRRLRCMGAVRGHAGRRGPGAREPAAPIGRVPLQRPRGSGRNGPPANTTSSALLMMTSGHSPSPRP